MTVTERRVGTNLLVVARDQLAHATVALWRTQVVLIFTFAMPLVWLILIGLLAGNEAVGDDGVRVMQFAAPTAIAMGTFFATMPPLAISVAEARENRILKRIRGTPLPAWCYFFGQVGASFVFAIGSLAVTVLVSVTVYGVRLQGETLLETSVTVVVGLAAFSAIGLAIGSLSRSASIAEAVSIGSAVVLSFISGLFLVGAALPSWLDGLASVFPLKPYAELLRDQFNPYLHGGWDPAALAVIGAWALLGALVSVRAFRWEAHRSGRPAVLSERTPDSSDLKGHLSQAVTTRRPSPLSLIALQGGAALRVVIRRPGDVFFSLVMPVGLFALLVSTQGNGTLPNGQPLALATAASMVTWGAGVAAFMNLAEGVARARDTRLLKRLRSTPLPAQDYLAGKAIAGLVVVTVLVIGILILAAVAYGLQIGFTGLALGAAIVVLGVGCLSACGFLLAAIVPSARAVGAVGLILLFVLSFFSDVFITAGPDWMGTVGAVFPLKHLQNGLATAWESNGSEIPWLNILVLSVWGIVAAVLAVRLFRWEPVST
ncbi:MAG: ABC transporter permease [Mycetocola sp.]